MNIKPIAQISAGQDGAIWGQYIFRFDTAGHCRVHALGSWEYVGEFTLDRADKLTPHSNAVVFGCEYYAPEDEFPLLYTNIDNTYSWIFNTNNVIHIYRTHLSKLYKILWLSINISTTVNEKR